MHKRQSIPVFGQPAIARSGFMINSLDQLSNQPEHDVTSAHRDDACLLFMLKQGFCRMMVDFDVIQCTGPMFGLIQPDQVHSLLEHHNLEGWMIAFDPGLLQPPVVPLLGLLTYNSVPTYQPDVLRLIYDIANVLAQTFRSHEPSAYHALTGQYLLNALITAIASLNQAATGSSPERIEKRADQITQVFRHLVKTNATVWKRPSQYAQAIHISINHLSDTIRQKTGFSVSYWIQHQIILEAKRLLYHTEQPVKAVAHQLGFDDQHYFSRLFRKVTGMTPVAFRGSFRDLSTTIA